MPTALSMPPDVAALVQALLVFVCVVAFLLAVRFFLFRRLKRWAAATASHLDDLVLASVTTPSLFWIIALGLDAALRVAPVEASYREGVSKVTGILVMLSITLVAANVAGGIVTQLLRRQSADGQVPGLGQAVIKALVVILGGMVVLNALGVEIAPLITALGVGGLAVALALQDTLTNFFAGLHILLERPFHIGNFIKLEDGQEGHVLDIGWRTTRVRTLQDDVIVVPNSKMAGSTILNYHMPIPRSRVTVRVTVAYGTDPDRAKAVLVDEAKKAIEALDYLLASPPPDALLLKLGEWALEYELRFYVTDIARMNAALDEMHRRLLKRLAAEKIAIPFPVREVYLRQDGPA